ncbi:GNAT family N-acetyltransferase [Catenulispora sp. NF23]|uniref:GNAT family N-acetyltransferase n=1 Tax=Catenulispora pinistramenti TaxID=2705254 RepID=UPI001BA4B78B|nr:GNAT family N-acetyltransferase [Catenulispora pinistramenti]MBS2536332.1 GNAT family N-acetyltransferase [Catenulispora pinistramenti]
MSEPVSPFAEYLPSPVSRAAAVVPALAEAVGDDLGALAEVQVEARGGVVSDWTGRIGRTLGDERSMVVVARVGAEVAGYANVIHLAVHAGDGAPEGHYLMGVSVVPRWRRRGIGDALTRWRMAWVWEREPDVWCFISAANPASIDLHLGLGFVEVRRAPVLQGVPFDCGEGVLLRARRP